MHALVFGFDAIGNPYGLVRGISQGVEQLVHEPLQGAIQGRAGFVKGLSLGARSLFGKTVGGVAGSASRITGTVGKCLSFLTFDKTYQKNRRAALLRRPSGLVKNLAIGSKDLVMDVVEGVSGIVTRPIEGAKRRGVGGFFAGLGKGAVGLVTRPVVAVVDFVTGTLNAIKT